MSEVKIWHADYLKRMDGGTWVERKVGNPYSSDLSKAFFPVVLASDYDAKAAECERLREALTQARPIVVWAIDVIPSEWSESPDDEVACLALIDAALEGKP